MTKNSKKTTENKTKFLLPNSLNWEELETDKSETSENGGIGRYRELLNQHLLSAMQMQNIVILAGSGTSLGIANGPSMKDLWDLCTKIDKKYTSNAKEIFKIAAYDTTDESKVNIEEFLSLCEAHLTIKINSKLQGFLDECKRKILAACSFSKTDLNIIAHKTFIHRLSRRRTRDSRLKLFTTNYDTCFEEAAGSNGIVVLDGFSFSKPREYNPKFFDYDIVKRNSNSTTTENYLEGVFQLFKLHGSVNWELEDGRITEKEATPHGVRMIFPAKGKYQQSYIQPHLELMARYLTALREPNTCLLVIGFGFNDDHLSEPIISAIQSNPYIKLVIVDFSAESNLEEGNKSVSKYWKNLNQLRKNGLDITFINSNFEDFANLIPDLRSLTPAERVANAIKGITEA
jgi:hypothetical protein